MKLHWEIEPQDVEHVRELMELQENNPFVQERIKRNLWKEPPTVSKEWFWDVMVACLLTSQQRSGPNSPVTKFISQRPFPLSMAAVHDARPREQFVMDTLTSWGGIRFSEKIGKQLPKNLQAVDSNRWLEIEETLHTVCQSRTPESETEAAEVLESMLVGIGPKQARNLLQGLGLTLYEIPIDTRIVKWLNRAGFPLKLSAGALSDKNYYSFLSRGIRELCHAAGVYPCVFDAAVFSRSDGDGWTTENVVW